MLDLYGTNHDARVWDEPHAFRHERWLYREPGRFDFVPQGGAEVAKHHRCPGEDVVLRLMLLAVQMLLLRLRYDVPVQNLSIAFQRLPAIPSDGFVIEGMQFAR
jgi:fatty-acid peroxygenase